MHFRIFIFLLILVAIDVYVFQGVKVLVQNKSDAAQRIIYSIYWIISAICFTFIILGNFFDWHYWPKRLRVYGFAMIAIIYFSKIFVVLFLVIDDLQRLIRWTVNA